MKFNIDEAHAARKAQIERRTAIREQITTDQQSNAKRDAKALRAEARWYAQQAKQAK